MTADNTHSVKCDSIWHTTWPRERACTKCGEAEHPGPVIGLNWDHETVLLRSRTSITRTALFPQTFERELPVFNNQGLPLRVFVDVDTEGIDVRVRDAGTTYLLEWRLEMSP